jgi:hypothetical protein
MQRLAASLAYPVVIAVVCLPLLTSNGWAQYSDELSRLRIEQLKQNDQLLRSDISGQRVDRQVEISRLEGRIAKLEEQLQGIIRGEPTSELLALVLLLDRMEQGAERVDAEDPDDSTQDARQSSSPKPPDNRERALMQLVAQDFSLQLDIGLLDAQAELLEADKMQQSLERLATKGMASSAQLEMQKLVRQRAELAVKRLLSRRDGLQAIYPQYFASPESVPAPQ